ncbi:MAG: four helix bundle protein [Chloroflexi bacterium]|nr:four helix bundle protein [Chloroflexota bacterium]
MEAHTKIRGFKDLIVWQRSLSLAVEIYRLTKEFPRDETYGLTSQIRRASVSIPSNLVEGHARNTKSQFANFIDIALGSAAELETQLTISLQIGYIKQADYDKLVNELTEITRMLYGLLNRVQPNRHAR